MIRLGIVKVDRIWKHMSLYFVLSEQDVVGSTYITYNDEVDIFIQEEERGKGYAKIALNLLIRRHKRSKYVARVDLDNNESLTFFHDMGFETKEVTEDMVKMIRKSEQSYLN